MLAYCKLRDLLVQVSSFIQEFSILLELYKTLSLKKIPNVPGIRYTDYTHNKKSVIDTVKRETY